MINISIVNRSTILKDSDVIPVMEALQIQLNRDVAKEWGVTAQLYFTAKNKFPTASHWQLVILDDSDQAGALGYHDLTSTGLPIGKVFAKSDLENELKWSVTTSHELLEMLIDPNINLVAFDENDSTLYAYEVCDACEADDYGYDINGVQVSDFVLPAWFEPLSSSGKFDYMGQIKGPLELLPGGYIGVYQIFDGTGWEQQTDELFVSPKSEIKEGSRRERRKRGIRKWRRSMS